MSATGTPIATEVAVNGKESSSLGPRKEAQLGEFSLVGNFALGRKLHEVSSEPN